MYLKRLELVGFKSFADRTEFEFPSSVTAVVGPNGCGKSNVVDAFKWIFGEQSAKGLRGEEMKDVIFNGTQARKAMGLSEVTVVFDNADHRLDIDYLEVAITRRLFRSGESEYLINKQKCRLRDIKELLLDTGLGTSAYSILEQGKIDVLLQASNQERRIIFEEAAGISKYRVKKAETLRALQRTGENLSRLGDIVDEVEKRMHRVKVQAGKARRYREYFERLRSLRMRLALEDHRALLDERVELSARRFLAEHRLARLEDLLARIGAVASAKRDERRSVGARLGGIRDSLAGARTRRERTEERIVQDRRRLEETAREAERKSEERAAAAAARERIAADLAAGRAEVAEAAARIAERRDLLLAKEGELAGLGKALEELRGEIVLCREAVVALLGERSRAGNRVVGLGSDLSNLAGRRDRVARALEGNRAEASRGAAERERLEGEARALREAIERIDRERAGLDEEAGARRKAIAGADAALGRIGGDLRDRRSRLEVLRRFEESREGVGRGVAALLDARQSIPEAAGIRGLVGEVLSVERRYARAVEAVLGDHAASLVVETQEGGLALLERVREGEGGGAEVIALDRIGFPGAREAEGLSLEAEAGVLGFLADRVEAPPDLSEVVERLLGGAILVEDLATGVALSRNGLRPYRIVTLDGALIEPWGAMALAGSGTAGGIVCRRSEMAELEAEIGALDAAHAEERGRRDEEAAALAEIEARIRETVAAREVEALRIGSTESLLIQAGRDLEHASREVRVGESELAEIVEREALLTAERAAAEEAARELDLRRADEEAALKEREARAVVAAEAHRTAAEAATELKVRLAEAEERGEGLRRAIARLEESLEEEERRQRALEEAIADLERRRQETEEDLRVSEGAMADLVSREGDLAAQVATGEEEERVLAEWEAALASELDRVRSGAEVDRTERERLVLREQELKLKRNSLVEKIADEYGLDLVAIAAGEVPPSLVKSFPPDVESPQEPPQTKAPQLEIGTGTGNEAAMTAVAPEAQAASLEPPAEVPGESPASSPQAPALPDFMMEDPSWNRDAAEAEIRELREKLRHLGNVNLEALDELDELEERHRFLVAQRDDLRKAERDLQGIIGEINRTSRELFSKTFEAVQVQFNEIFRKCFGGGMAELVLEDGADILEAGIEIIARPPGKKLTSLTLMSGGEKTMTTIALLFAIFRSRPSPFCILDEVDAPLDENNVRRFVVLLRDFIKESQFIIITHNKITMAEADTLYGITMEERGVSKQVAVQFESYDPDALQANTVAGAGEVLGTGGDAEPSVV